jgi:transcriptional regulator with XRE-family HTH domain
MREKSESSVFIRRLRIPKMRLKAAWSMQKPLQEKIRELRKKRKFTLEQLAQKAGCSKSYISQLEKGKTVPSVSMLGRLASALDSQVSELLSENNQEFQWDWHLPKPERRIIQYPDGKVASQLLTRGVFQKKMQPVLTIIEPGGTSDKIGKLIHPPGSEEFVLVLEGEIDFWIGTDRIMLKEGDTLYFKGDQAHGWANCGKKTARVLFTWTPPVW